MRVLSEWAILLTLMLTFCNCTENGHSEEENLVLNVVTKSGPVRGFILDKHPKGPVVAFYGIPYSQPPIKNLRFKPPLPVKPWTEVFQADSIPARCHQTKIPKIFDYPEDQAGFDEDCLKLHVWVPLEAPKDAAVIVYIHGGAFLVGSALDPFSEGLQLAAQEKVIVVHIAYRLGALGFLYLGNEDAPGNMGLMDQQLALKWVKSNIAAFGGCPDKITAFGVSAGSSSVGFQLLSEGSKDLFNRAIMVSGSPANPWAYRDPEVALGTAQYAAKLMGFKGEVEDIFDFLLNKDVSEIIDVEYNLGLLNSKHFGPTVDGTFITESPIKLIAEGRFVNTVEVLIGSASDEASLFLLVDFPELAAKKEDLVLDKKQHLAVIQKMSLKELTDLQTEVVSHFYINWTVPDSGEMLRDTALAAAADAEFVCDIEILAESLSKAGNKVFRYVFDVKLLPFLPSWSGACHGNELLLSTVSLEIEKMMGLPEEVRKFASDTRTRWANFVRTGEPLPAHNAEPDWPRYTPDKRTFVTVKLDGNRIGQHHKVRECAMWHKLLPLISN